MILKQKFRVSPKFKSPFSANNFSNLFFMKTAKDFQDGHIWFSVINRPPCSTFTRVQRVSCCFSLLLCTMLTSIMFWGIPTDPSEQTMDLGRKYQHDTKWTNRPSLQQNTIPLSLCRSYWVHLAAGHDRSSKLCHHVPHKSAYCKYLQKHSSKGEEYQNRCI